MAEKRRRKTAKTKGNDAPTIQEQQNNGISAISNPESKNYQEVNYDTAKSCGCTLEGAFGFNIKDLCSWNKLVKLMNRPCDPSSLGIFRFAFGMIMLMDTIQERGLSQADYRYGDPDECRFPLFDFLRPLPLPWMYVVYLILLMGAFGIMVGFLFRLSCLLFMVPYWYIFMLDKTTWNNHSYLYGLCSGLLFVSDANRYWSIDGLIWPSIRNTEVPLWNYTLIRTQFFLVYFIAGLKKLEPDWVGGYSMQKLSYHWVFSPFKQILSNDDIDLWVVHRGGLFIDFFMGYFLFFDYTRPLGVIISLSFHGMNSQLFTIGMFPYTMIASTPIFSAFNWPKQFICVLPGVFKKVFSLQDAQPSVHCIYPDLKPQKYSAKGDAPVITTQPKIHRKTQATCYNKIATFGVLMYISVQCFLPYSHSITKGYNNWTNGLYGYSWDMMVHAWSTQHVRITYLSKDTGQQGYLNPEAWTRGASRWSAHSDMVKQYAMCIQDRLVHYNITNIELYFDVWRSLNDRFQQRMFDPKVNIITAEWHPFQYSTWIKPLLVDLSEWRAKLDEIENSVYEYSNNTDVVFIADFPGLKLENFVQKDLGNTSLTLLNGEVIVELVEQNKNKSLSEGERIQLPPGEYHNVYTISSTPSCYMYIFVNTTEVVLNEKIKKYESSLLEIGSSADKDTEPEVITAYKQVKEKREEMENKMNETPWQSFMKFAEKKIKMVVRSAIMMQVAFTSLITGESFEAVFNATVTKEPDFSKL